jgi:hypothetical protein
MPHGHGVDQLVILGEAGEASWYAARASGQRWRAAGRKVLVTMPGNGLSDMNDALRENVGWHVAARFLP